MNDHISSLDSDVIKSADSILIHELLTPTCDEPDGRSPELVRDLDPKVGALRIELAILVLAILDIPAVSLEILDKVQGNRDRELALTTFLVETRRRPRKVREE